MAASRRASTSTWSRVGSRPILMAAGGRSTPRASIWAVKVCISTGSTIFTATEFWAVMAEMTEQPCTPRSCNVCKSA